MKKPVKSLLIALAISNTTLPITWPGYGFEWQNIADRASALWDARPKWENLSGRTKALIGIGGLGILGTGAGLYWLSRNQRSAQPNGGSISVETGTYSKTDFLRPVPSFENSKVDQSMRALFLSLIENITNIIQNGASRENMSLLITSYSTQLDQISIETRIKNSIKAFLLKLSQQIQDVSYDPDNILQALIDFQSESQLILLRDELEHIITTLVYGVTFAENAEYQEGIKKFLTEKRDNAITIYETFYGDSLETLNSLIETATSKALEVIAWRRGFSHQKGYPISNNFNDILAASYEIRTTKYSFIPDQFNKRDNESYVYAQYASNNLASSFDVLHIEPYNVTRSWLLSNENTLVKSNFPQIEDLKRRAIAILTSSTNAWENELIVYESRKNFAQKLGYQPYIDVKLNKLRENIAQYQQEKREI